MLLQRGRLAKISLSKLKLKPAIPSLFRVANFESSFCSPKSVLLGEDMDSGDEAGDRDLFHVVPKGCFAVYVGKEDGMRRFVIPLRYLNHAIFQDLLKKAEEEFGFSSSGGIRLPCGSLLFEHILWMLENDEPMIKNLKLDDLMNFYRDEDCGALSP
ncbi:Auxin-responsive protein [Nymphaea thermarum]|nr:Auxin-responsive protein [Nymphaea thermarum]